MRDVRIRAMNEPITRLLSTADGKLLGIAGGESVGVVNMVDCAVVHALNGACYDDIQAMLFAEGPTPLLLFASDDAGVRILDTATGKPRLLKGHTDAATGLALDTARERFASCSVDGSVRVWSLPSGEPIACLRGHREGAIGCAFAQDGRLLSFAGNGDRFLWSPLLKLEKHLPGDPKQKPAESCVAVHSLLQGLLLVSTERPNLVLWDRHTGEILWKHAGASLATAPHVEPSTARVVFAKESAGASVLDIATGKVVAKWPDFSGAWLLCEQYAVRRFQGNVDLFDMKAKRVCGLLDDLDEEVTAVIASPTTASWPWLALGLGDGSVRILDLKELIARPVVHKPKPKERVHFIARHASVTGDYPYVFTEDRKQVIVTCDSALRWISVDDGRVSREVPGEARSPLCTGKYVCCDDADRLAVYLADTGDEWMHANLPYGTYSMTICGPERIVIYGEKHEGSEVQKGWCVVDLARREIVAQIPVPPDFRKVDPVWRCGSERFVFAEHSTNPLLHVFSTEDGALVVTLPVRKHRGDDEFGLTADGRYLIACPRTAEAVLYDLPSGEPRFRFGKDRWLRWKFFANDTRMWLGAEKGRVVLLDITNAAILKELHLPLKWVGRISSDRGEERWCFEDDKQVILYDLQRGEVGRFTGGSASWSPDGSRLAIVDGNAKCIVCDRDGRKRGTAFIKWPNRVEWAPGGRVLQLQSACQNEDVYHHVHLLDASGNYLGALCDPETGVRMSDGSFADDTHFVALRRDVLTLWRIDDC